jgi:arsenate reductase
MSLIYLHNPNCSTSRKGLALLEEKGVEFTVRKYMNESEKLSVEDIKDIAKKLGVDSPMAFARKKNFEAEGVALDISDEDLFVALSEHPKIMERPILIKGDKAVLGRPVDKLLELL